MSTPAARVAGLLLAAGAGRRMGGPKALVRDDLGDTWVLRAARTLLAAGCDPVAVVVGAEADAVRSEVAGEPVEVVHADAWRDGMGASLRAGLSAIARREDLLAVIVVPVDMPRLTPAAVRRVAAAGGSAALVRATYSGTPGHPVLIGRQHWAAVAADAHGDVGARDYLRARDVTEVECGGPAEGADVDDPEQLPRGHTRGQRGTAGSS